MGYFFVSGLDNGIATRELWRSDGTHVGTGPIMSFTGGAHSMKAYGLTATPAGVAFLYLEGEYPVTRLERWTSDGTPTGTRLAETLAAGTGRPKEHVFANGHWFMVTYDRRLSIDGTVLQDLHSVHGPANTDEAPWNPAALTVGDDGTVYFAAGGSGLAALWASDGTIAGTRRVTEAGVMYANPQPENIVEVNGAVYFASMSALSRFADGKLTKIEFGDAFFEVPPVEPNHAMRAEVAFAVRTARPYTTDESPDHVPDRSHDPFVTPADLAAHADAIRVIGPDGAPRRVRVTGADQFGVTLAMSRPDGGPVTVADNGTYSVELAPGRLANSEGEPVSGRVIGRLVLDAPTDGPDLVPTLASELPATVAAGQKLRVNVTVENRGNVPASGPFELRVEGLPANGAADPPGEPSLGFVSIQRFHLAPGRRKTFRVQLNAHYLRDVSERRLQAKVGYLGGPAEINTANNTAQGSTVALVESRITPSLPSPPPSLHRGEGVTLTARLENLGARSTRTPVSLRLAVLAGDGGRDLLARTRRVSFGPAGSALVDLTFAMPADLPAGRHTLRLFASARGAFAGDIDVEAELV